MNSLSKIRALIEYLPERDIPIAKKFLEDRDFDCLKEIIYSDIYKIEKYSEPKNSKYNYNEKEIKLINLLYSEVDSYIATINGVLPRKK